MPFYFILFTNFVLGVFYIYMTHQRLHNQNRILTIQRSIKVFSILNLSISKN